MKNLQVYCDKLIDYEVDAVAQCLDADNVVLYILDKDFTLFKAEVQSEHQKKSLVDHDFNHLSCGISLLEPDDVRLFEFVVETGSILVALKAGLVVSIGVSSFSEPSRCVYKHEFEISSIKLSPDQDLITLADKQNNIHILTCNFDILFSNNALTQTNSLHKPVGVGWGSKETQFFGLDGRPSREQQSNEQFKLNDDNLAVKDIIESSETFRNFRRSQQKSTVIDWRGDGQYISTLTYYPDQNKHCMKVWNRNLELQYMSEQLVAIERGILAWIPNGRYVCCGQRRDHGINDIVMLEKNGMVHQRISLPTMINNLYIRDVVWSPDSKILAVIGYKFQVDIDGSHWTPILMLYTMQNFHYYLKFTSCLQKDCDYIPKWNTINQNRLHLLSSGGHYSEYICSTETTFTRQYSTVAVIDANRILITPTDKCNIPPPMSAIVIQLKSLVSKLVMNPLKADNLFIVTMDDKLIYTSSRLALNENTSVDFCLEHHVAAKLYNDIKRCHVVDLPDARYYQNITPINEISLVATRSTSRGCVLLLLKLPVPETNEGVVIETLASFEGKQISSVSRDTSDEIGGVAAIFNDGTCHWIDLSSGQSKLLFELPTNAMHGYNMINLQTIRTAQSTAVISLTHDLSLRLNSDVILAGSCTSFRVTENYLVYTTTDNNIHFTLIERLLSDRESIGGSWMQQIEAGGVLVVVDERDSRVVLQMPRGNLEILHPRLLIFSLLTELLDDQNYTEAMKMARQHRLHMNFLCDYLFQLSHSMSIADDMPDSSTNAVDLLYKFGSDIADQEPSLFCIFLTELNEENTMNGRYKSLLKHLPKRKLVLQKPLETRECNTLSRCLIDIICSGWLKRNSYAGEKLKPTLLCYLKLKLIPDALKLIKGLETSLQKEALKFILYFVDIDQLFREALGTYDTEIALIVAGASNKDPKEYLLLLNDVDKIECNHLRSYQIDMHIKRYDEALKHLARLYKGKPTSELNRQIMDLIVSKRLYKEALSFFNNLSIDDLLELTWKNYANYLLEKRYYTEAGLAYSKSFNINPLEEYFKASIRSYLLGNDFEKAIAVIARFGIDRVVAQESMKQVIRKLVDCDRIQEAGIILRDMPDKEMRDCCRDLMKRGNWYLVDYIYRNDSTKDFQTDLRNCVLKYSREQCTDWEAEMDMAEKQLERLKNLLTTHSERASGNPDSCFISDSLSTIDGSELSSTASDSVGQPDHRSGVSSIKTRNSSKTTKSQASKKKRISLKEGSTNEDIALVLELKKFISKQKIHQEEAMRFSAALFDFCEHAEADSRSREARKCLNQSFELSKEILELLWPTNQQVEQRYSLYRKFQNALSPSRDTYHNVDFEVLLRPELTTEPIFFEI